ncbi:MAG TPA: hypothetical protein VMV49_04280 [Candidatus Deferrimicrobium sp.]|nr:hypothetical protein [Candidatus Deferrimicrobium sp.]
MSSYETEKENLKKIAQYLEKEKVSYKWEDLSFYSGEKWPAIKTTYIYKDTKHTHKDYGFDLLIGNSEDWFEMKCLVLKTDQLTKDLRYDIYEWCLSLNFELWETTFSAFFEQIFVESDMPLNISYEDFKYELQALKKGIDLFIELVIQKACELSDTAGKLDVKKLKKRK